MPPGDHLPAETVELILRLYLRERRPRSEVARLASVSPTVVGGVVRARGFEMRSRGGRNYTRLPHYEYQRTARMYEELEMSELEIAEALGVSRGAVQWRLDYAGVPRRSRSEANRAAIAHGRAGAPLVGACGEAHPSSRLTAAAVAEIRRRAASGEQQAVLAREFGVTEANVSLVVRRKTWRSVP